MEILRVKEPFSITVNGSPYGFSPGELVDADAPFVKGREHLFEAASLRLATVPTETASAEPGRRRVRTAAKKAAGKRTAAKKAGTGQVVSAETGQVTELGDPLPPIEQPDGTPLSPTDED